MTCSLFWPVSCHQSNKVGLARDHAALYKKKYQHIRINPKSFKFSQTIHHRVYFYRWCALSILVYYQEPHPRYLYVFLRCFSFNEDWFLIFLFNIPKVNIHIFKVFETFIYKQFSSGQFTMFSICLWYFASLSLLSFPTSSALSAHFTKGHESSVFLQSGVYNENRKGAETMPWGAPVFVHITDDSTPFRRTFCNLLVS